MEALSTDKDPPQRNGVYGKDACLGLSYLLEFNPMLFLRKLFIDPHQDGRTSTVFIFLSALTSYLIMGWVYPDLLVSHRVLFSHHSDPAIPFEGVFSLISHYYHGGIQLWDRFDQMNLNFLHVTSGLYTLANVATVAAYILFVPLFDYPGEAFQNIYTVVFHGSTLLIRTVGGYLLLRRFQLHPLVIFVSLIYLNTLLSSILYLGLLTNCLYSLFPLLIYFILRFFESFRLNDFLGAILFLTLAVANSPAMALGYFYQAVHFFILTCLVVSILSRGERSIKHLFSSVKKGWSLSVDNASIPEDGKNVAGRFLYP